MKVKAIIIEYEDNSYKFEYEDEDESFVWVVEKHWFARYKEIKFINKIIAKLNKQYIEGEIK